MKGDWSYRQKDNSERIGNPKRFRRQAESEVLSVLLYPVRWLMSPPDQQQSQTSCRGFSFQIDLRCNLGQYRGIEQIMPRSGQKMRPPPNKMSYSSECLKSQKIKEGLDQITDRKVEIGKVRNIVC